MSIREIPWRRMASYAISGIIVLVLIALIVPAIRQARDTARSSTSRNNLKQLGLALHNYYDTNDCLPPGGVIAADGVGHHGWPIQIQPYLDASPLYNMTDMDTPWNIGDNREVFRRSYPVFLMPGSDARFTKHSGCGLTHYMANPNIFHRNSSTTFDDCTAGTSHTWFIGEAAGNYQPWGYPYNWRSLGTRLNDGVESFGNDYQLGVHLLIGDGAVSTLSTETSPAVLRKLANAPPVAKAEDVKSPRVTFEYRPTLLRHPHHAPIRRKPSTQLQPLHCEPDCNQVITVPARSDSDRRCPVMQPEQHRVRHSRPIG